MTAPSSVNSVRIWLTLVALSAPILALSVDMNGVVVLLSDIGSDLGVTATTAGAIVTVASVAFAAPLLLIGRAADRFGSRPLLLWGVALFWAASAVCAFAESFSLLMVGRTLQGVASACCLTTSLAVIDAIFDRRRQPIAVGIWGGIGGLGGAVGPLIAALIASMWSWRAFFGVNLVILAVAFIALFFLVPNLPKDSTRPLPLLLLVVLMIGIAGTIGGIQNVASSGWFAASTVLPIAVGLLALLAVWFLREPSAPLILPSVSGNRSFRVGTSVATLSNWGSGVVMVLVPIALQTIRGSSVSEMGWIFLGFSAPFAAGGAISGPWINKLGRASALGVGSLLLTAGTMVLVFSGVVAPLTYVIIGLAIAGFGNGVVYSAATSVALVDVDVKNAGEASAVLSMIRVIGLALAVAVSTSVMSRFDGASGETGLRIVLLCSAAITAVGIPAATQLRRVAN
jgi:MFS family permease